MRIAIDTGGTFTDCVYFSGGELQILKAPSTPADPGRAVVNALREIRPGSGAEIGHGTTVGTNALLERKGARVAFVTTAGFEDTIAIGRQARPKLYDWFASPEPSLAPAELRFGVKERTLYDGTVLEPATPAELARLANALRAAQPESIAVSLLFSFANPENERAVVTALGALGVPISASHEILPEFREYERGSTLLVNAYLAPMMRCYLSGLQTALAADGSRLHIMQSSGGIVPAPVAAREPVRTILSGPAGGVVGAFAVARAAGYSRIITFDMGGTSTDVSLVNDGDEGGLRTTNEFHIMGLPVAVPILDIHTVGAGGGSLASFDLGGALRVGPESAGADPGPVCYGRGALPTVTDANLLLGRIDPDFFLGGGMTLDEKRTRPVFDRAKGRLSSVEEFADGILRVADETMEKALRKMSVERGHDPRDFTLFSFGGAGPLHACSLARALRLPRVLVPRFPGALSALGILMSDMVMDYSKTVMLAPEDRGLDRHFRELERRGKCEMTSEGLKGVAIRSLDLRYVGQGYEMNVDWTPGFVAKFHAAHAQRYGYADERRPVEVVNVRVRMAAATKPIPFAEHRLRPGNARQAILKKRRVYFDNKATSCSVYDRARLHAGDRFAGPAVIVEYSATTLVPPGCRVRVDKQENLIIDVESARGHR